MELLERFALARSKVCCYSVEEEGRLVEKALRRLHTLDYDTLGYPLDLALILFSQFFPGVNDYWKFPEPRFFLDLCEQLQTCHV
jgi:hypothetical protein